MATESVITIKMTTEFYNKLNEILLPQDFTIESALILFINETVRLGKIPFDYTEEDVEKAKHCKDIEVIWNES